MIQPIYLDYNGTTPHDPEVVAATWIFSLKLWSF
jgi:hypothetical protein